ncbi:cytochrome b/b6 domain-containing protein [Henriciella sp. AS95]|uniref:cytochrome b/b6 domain-containing protein n=1 Tax=Henriciella sp. AS95 TaxID=3135782 RepID=UPI0031821017
MSTNSQADPAGKPARIAVWDLAIRLWHWLIAALIPAMWYTAEEHMFGLHRTLGIVLVGLLAFRLVWGVIGSRTARFTALIRAPAAIAGYAIYLLRPGYRPGVGHNPLGALSVIALMLALVAQTISGLFAVDTDGLNSGPLSRFVSFGFGRDAADFHEASFNILLALIALHLAAIAFYLLAKKTNLISPMVTGKARVDGEPNTSPSVVSWLVAVAIAGAVGAYLLQL